MTMRQLFELHDANDILLVSEWPAGMATCPKWTPDWISVYDAMLEEPDWFDCQVDLISSGVIYYRGK